MLKNSVKSRVGSDFTVEVTPRTLDNLDSAAISEFIEKFKIEFPNSIKSYSFITI